MKLDDKRKVIEVLLCCGSGGVPIFLAALDVAFDDDSERRLNNEAYSHFVRLDFSDISDAEHHRLAYAQICLEAAYRLIESSPTLRREWFGC